MNSVDTRWAPRGLSDVSEDDSQGYVLGVRDSTDLGAWSLLLMEYTEGDEQDIDLGMDTYCLVVDPGQATYYGGVLECEVTAERLRLLLAEEAAATLRMPAETIFWLQLSNHQLDLLRRGLTRVLTSGRPSSIPTRLSV